MKKILFLSVSLALILAGCQQTPKEPVVDLDAEKAAIGQLFDKFMQGIELRSVDTIVKYINDDLLACGTDPSEFWNKKEMIDIWNQMLSNNLPVMKFMGDKVIKVAPDGNSAIAVDQFYTTFTPEIAWRNVYWLNKIDGKWMISFWSNALIPKNEDLSIINDAVANKNDGE